MLGLHEIGPDDPRLASLEPLHRQLRPQIPSDYAAALRLVMADGAHVVAAFDALAPRGLAVWRSYRNTSQGRRFYVDDLVTDEAARSTGVGRALMVWLEARARALGCPVLSLDSGIQRARAHRFYFREGLAITTFGFTKSLD